MVLNWDLFIISDDQRAFYHSSLTDRFLLHFSLNLNGEEHFHPEQYNRKFFIIIVLCVLMHEQQYLWFKPRQSITVFSPGHVSVEDYY